MSRRTESLISLLSIAALLLIIAYYLNVYYDLSDKIDTSGSCMLAGIGQLVLVAQFAGIALSLFVTLILIIKQSFTIKLSFLRGIKFFVLYFDLGVVGYLLGGMTSYLLPTPAVWLIFLLAPGFAIALPILAARFISRTLKKETVPAYDSPSPSNLEEMPPTQ